MKSCTVNELKAALRDGQKGVHFVDVRTEIEFRGEHIAGVENIPLDQVEKYADHFCKYDRVYVNCRSGGRSAKAIEKLGNIDTELVNVRGGLLAWKAAGFEIIKGGPRIPLIRQVMIGAGALVLVGALGSLWFYELVYLSVFVGAGLLFAGLTGFCGMAKCLAFMPWNK